jgi:predicted nucleic acid-binding protein
MIARGAMDEGRAQEALERYRGLSLERVGHELLLDRVLSLRNNFTAYDATYVALAEVLGAPLHTADLRLARAVREHTEVEVVEV